MSKDEVKEIEQREFTADEGKVQESISYSDKISNLECVLAYIFVKDKLSSAGYIITENHANNNAYIDDYEYLKELLEKKYGEPLREDITWKSEQYKDDKSNWGMAISKGDLIYTAHWETPTTEIDLLLTGDNYKIEFVLKYVSKELKDWATNTVREASLDNL
jgi:hypothetical protein